MLYLIPLLVFLQHVLSRYYNFHCDFNTSYIIVQKFILFFTQRAHEIVVTFINLLRRKLKDYLQHLRVSCP